MASDAPMRALGTIALGLVGTTLGLGGSLGSARASEPCERPGLTKVLAKLPGSAALVVDASACETRLTDRASGKVVLEATCHGVTIPLAEGLATPTPKRASTVRDGRYTVSRTARGAISLSIAPGIAATDGIEVVTFDDDSISVTDTRGRVWYSVATKADGTQVEVEGAHVGCGCERTTTADGHVSERRR